MMQPVVREPSNVRSLETRLAVEMLPALATIRVWFLTQVGDEEFDIRTSGRAMLKRLDGFEASLKLLIETLDDVRRARQARCAAAPDDHTAVHGAVSRRVPLPCFRSWQRESRGQPSGVLLVV